MSYPIPDDERYEIQMECCGHPEPRYVLRFCNDWIDQSISYSSMVTRAVGHNDERLGAGIVTEGNDMTALDEARAKLDEIMEERVEHATSHEDAGGNYAHMPAEGDTADQSARLWEFCQRLGVPFHDRYGVDELWDIAHDAMRMVPRHMFSATPDDVFSFDSYAVGEIEDQLTAAEIGCSAEVFAKLAEKPVASDGSALFYRTTDVRWCAEITLVALREAVRDHAET